MRDELGGESMARIGSTRRPCTVAVVAIVAIAYYRKHVGRCTVLLFDGLRCLVLYCRCVSRCVCVRAKMTAC